jgi:hypothetical protein
MRKNDSVVQAFPAGSLQDPGMTLRDWFAGQALVGISGAEVRAFAIQEDASDDVRFWAKASYIIADAMLAARDMES